MIALYVAALLALAAFALFAARRSSYHRGKSDAFQQVADDFTGLSRATWLRNRDRQRQERKKAMLNLCLCDPAVCEALAEALTEARAHWHHPSPPAHEGPEKPSEHVGTSREEA